MNEISDNTKNTFVKILVNTLASASLLFSNIVWAQATTPPATTTPATTQAQADALDQVSLTQAIQNMNNAASAEERNHEACQDEIAAINEATTKIGEACRKAGLGGASDCVGKARSCEETMGEESFDTIGALAAALGVAGSTPSAVEGACPQLNGRDYYEEKDKLNQEIKDINKELGDLDKEKADAKKEYDEAMDEINEALAKAQEEYKEKELEISQAERDRVAEFNKIQSQTADELRKTGDEILKLEGALIAAQRDKAQKMIGMSEAAAQRACQKEVKKVRDEYLAISASSSGNHISQAKQKKEQLIKTFTDCMSSVDQQRISLNESKTQEYATLNRQIANLKTRQDEIQGSLNLADQQLKEMKEASLKEKSNALQSVVDLGQRSQLKMKAAYENMTANQAAIDKKIASLTAALNRANVEMMKMGPVPAKGTEYSPSQASSEIDTQLDIIQGYVDNPSCTKAGDRAKEAKRAWGTQ